MINSYIITVSNGNKTSSFEFKSEKEFEEVLNEIYSEIIF